MSSKRTRHTEEYKREALRLCESLENISQAAKQLGISPNLLYRWRREVDLKGDKAFSGHGVISHDEELIRLRRDLKRVTEERDFLKKTAVFFARDSK